MTAHIAVYPGTFDPITKGHCDIIKRTLPLVDKLIIGVAQHSEKTPLFTLDERVALVKEQVQEFGSQVPIDVQSFDKLLVDFAKNVGAQMLVRGLRAVSDFEYEFKMAAMNSRLAPNIETVFLMASDKYQFVSSRFVKEVCRLGGDISDFVSPKIRDVLTEKYRTVRHTE